MKQMRLTLKKRISVAVVNVVIILICISPWVVTSCYKTKIEPPMKNYVFKELTNIVDPIINTYKYIPSEIGQIIDENNELVEYDEFCRLVTDEMNNEELEAISDLEMRRVYDFAFRSLENIKPIRSFFVNLINLCCCGVAAFIYYFILKFLMSTAFFNGHMIALDDKITIYSILIGLITQNVVSLSLLVAYYVVKIKAEKRCWIIQNSSVSH